MAQQAGVQLVHSIGIDFGNRYSSIAVHNYPAPNDVTVLQATAGATTKRVLMHVARDANAEDGYVAGPAVTAQQHGARDLKRHLGRRRPPKRHRDPIMAGKVHYTPQGHVVQMQVDEHAEQSDGEPKDSVVLLVSELFRHLAGETVQYIGNPATEVAISVPCHFGQDEMAVMREAAEDAGLRVTGLIEDPIAAALGFTTIPQREAGYETEIRGKRFAVLDMGDCCLTASILSCTPEGEIRIEATQYNPNLGGVSFDRCLLTCFTENLDDVAYTGTAAQRMSVLLSEAERVKLEFVPQPQRDEVFAQLPAVGLKRRAVSREEFERLCEGQYRKVAKLLERLKRSKAGEATLDFVLLVGGSARLPRVRDTVEEILVSQRSPIFISAEVDVIVARGVALYAHLLRQRDGNPEYTIVEFQHSPSRGGDYFKNLLHGFADAKLPAVSAGCLSVFRRWFSGEREIEQEQNERNRGAPELEGTFKDYDPTHTGPPNFEGARFWAVTLLGSVLCVPSSWVHASVGIGKSYGRLFGGVEQN
ncbi:putative Chaperone protein DnaK [Hypsibius exemplaris]|uniref:Chaperone protein DnaK n=1 Tax=Hypsibius exemplaris TaxID=2072580 RepID=A0A1W0WZG1_HYPEX|nr:putative Chaperone protein DnaK [Hypsibius exemplaris]